MKLFAIIIWIVATIMFIVSDSKDSKLERSQLVMLHFILALLAFKEVL